MVYRSSSNGGSIGWGFWEIVPNQDFEMTTDYALYIWNGDLARLFCVDFTNDNNEREKVYKSNGEEISKEQYDRIAEELMGSIDCILFQGLYSPKYGLYNSFDELWKDHIPLNAENMTYDEAVAWLEEQGKGK